MLDNVDIVDVHMLPFFSAQASLGMLNACLESKSVIDH